MPPRSIYLLSASPPALGAHRGLIWGGGFLCPEDTVGPTCLSKGRDSAMRFGRTHGEALDVADRP